MMLSDQYRRRMATLNMDSPKWVADALRHWSQRKPGRNASVELIAWNIEMLSKMLDRLESRCVAPTEYGEYGDV